MYFLSILFQSIPLNVTHFKSTFHKNDVMIAVLAFVNQFENSSTSAFPPAAMKEYEQTPSFLSNSCLILLKCCLDYFCTRLSTYLST